MRLHQHEENDKKNKGIALKASSSSIQEKSDKEDLNEIEEDDDFRFFVQRFNIFMRNRKSKEIKYQSKEEWRKFLLSPKML